MFIHRDLSTGDVILSRKPLTWEYFLMIPIMVAIISGQRPMQLILTLGWLSEELAGNGMRKWCIFPLRSPRGCL